MLDLVQTWLQTPTSDGDVVIEEACRVIGEVQPPAGIDLLIRVIREPRVHGRVKEAAALAISRIEPERLIAETDSVVQRVLGRFSLETGRLIFGDTMIVPDKALSEVVIERSPSTISLVFADKADNLIVNIESPNYGQQSAGGRADSTKGL